MHFNYKKDKEFITIEDEVSLSSKPLKIDVLLIKLIKDVKLSNPIADIFKHYNIIEFKSPSDRLEATDFDTGIIYAKLHQVLKNPKIETTDDYTIEQLSHLLFWVSIHFVYRSWNMKNYRKSVAIFSYSNFLIYYANTYS